MADQSFLRIRDDLQGKGGRRKGFSSRNEIEDMRLFDGDPGKNPSQADGKPPPEAPIHEDSEAARPQRNLKH